MDPIEKALKKLSEKERSWISEIFQKLTSGDTEGLDIKKLKGRSDIFRVRRGDIRIIYRKTEANKIFILLIERPRESTYDF